MAEIEELLLGLRRLSRSYKSLERESRDRAKAIMQDVTAIQGQLLSRFGIALKIQGTDLGGHSRGTSTQA